MILSQDFNVPFLCFFSFQGLIYNDMSLVTIVSSFNIQDKFITEIRADGSISVHSPLLPELPMFSPQGYLGSWSVPASNHIKTCVTGLGFKQSSAVVPDLSVFSTVGRDAYRHCPCICWVPSDGQIFILGSVPYSDVHCRLPHRAHRTDRFPPTECCPIWDLIRHKEDLPSQEIGTFISYPSARNAGKKNMGHCKQPLN